MPCSTRDIKAVCGAFSFAFVRNPWDRLYSTYKDKIFRHASRPAKEMAKAFRFMQGWSFARFVRHAAAHPLSNTHWIPYSETCFAPGIQYDYIGKMEDEHRTLSEQIRQLFKNAGLPHPRTPVFNKHSLRLNPAVGRVELRHQVYLQS